MHSQNIQYGRLPKHITITNPPQPHDMVIHNFLSQQKKPKNCITVMNCMQKRLSNTFRSIDAITAHTSCPHLHTPESKNIWFDFQFKLYLEKPFFHTRAHPYFCLIRSSQPTKTHFLSNLPRNHLAIAN